MKRSGDALESGSTKERKKEEGGPQDAGKAPAPKGRKCEVNMEDSGIFSLNEDNARPALAPRIFRTLSIYQQRAGRRTKIV